MAKNKKEQSEVSFDKLIEVTQQLVETTPKSSEVLNQAAETLVAQYNNIPPRDWTRNKYGLLNHINYIFNEDGSVNWRAMIPNEFLVPNKQNFERRKKPVPQSIEGLEDKDLLVLLGGIKYLANLRGFTSVDHEVTTSSEAYVSVKTTICLLPNYETDFKQVCFSDLADAATFNTNSFAKYYLNAIAANRGFVRAWRNALRLPITAFDEVGETPKEEEDSNKNKSNPVGPHVTLQKKMDEKNISFEKLKATCIKKEYSGATEWESIADISSNDIQKILISIKEKDSANIS